MKLVFATNNDNKAAEIQKLMPSHVRVLTLADIGCSEDIPETGTTLRENALIKARFVSERFGYDCFADDTGLEIEALNGEPGVFSARYAGPSKNAGDNMNLVLQKLQGKNDRSAQFRTVIALIIQGNEHIFEGSVSGSITMEKSGSDGFGYDPIFRPEGFDRTFAEMTLDEKNRVSHRGKAVRKLVYFLR